MNEEQNQLGSSWRDAIEGGQNRHGEELDNLRCISIEDNNHPANCNSNNPQSSAQQSRNKRKLQRQRTLSIAKPVLEELLQKIEALERNFKASAAQNIQRTSGDGESHTATTPQNCMNDESKDNAAANTSDGVIARNLQIGHGNFMVFCENVESKSERQLRQIGNKNVFININTCSNKCQILDNINNQIVPLDSEGEIWLEIKQRSLTDARGQTGTGSDQPTPPSAPNVFQQDGMNDLSRDCSIKYTEHVRVPSMPRRLPMQHSNDSEYNNHVDSFEDGDPTYDKIIEHPGGRLSAKISIPIENEDSTDFTIQNLNSFLNDDRIQQYLSAGGENFELNVCKWHYEKEEIYSTIDVLKPTVQHHIYSEFPPSVPPRATAAVRDQPPQQLAPPPPLNQDRKIWYHGTMDKKQAQMYLKDKQNGAFLVRKATQPDSRHKYTIECVDEGRIRRLKILNSKYGYYFEYSENRTFDSLDSLIKAIEHAGLEIKEDGGKWKTVAVFPV